MTATNHAITGAVIAIGIHNPLLAIPFAFISHFVCDAIPHFGMKGVVSTQTWLKSPLFRKILIADTIGCIILVLVLIDRHPLHWLLASFCAFVATLPDMFWINRFIKARTNKKWRPNPLSRFASKIQWFEKPVGAFVEIVWFFSGLAILFSLMG